MVPIWKSLKDLGEIDHRKNEIISKINVIEKKVAEEESILPELQATVDDLKRENKQAKKRVDFEELKAESSRTLEREKRKALDVVQSQKACNSLQRELNLLNRQGAEQESVLIKAWHTLEEVEKKLKTGTEENIERGDQIKKAIEEHQKELETLNAKLMTINEEWDKKSVELTPEWLKKYSYMQDRIENPVVVVLGESCSECYYSVAPQDFTRLKKGLLLPCRSCYRLLYYNEQQEKETKSESY
jgi:uncharacterized protein